MLSRRLRPLPGLLLLGQLAAPLHADTTLANVYARTHVSLNGQWHYIVDPYENGFYDYRHEPFDAAPTFTVQLDDGSGRIDAVFMGRRSIPGIEPGARLTLEGTVCAAQALPRMFNPRYELRASA